MFTNYKLAVLNYTVMMLFIPFLTMIQNSFWPSIFGNQIPIYLWIPCVIYWALYRRTGETVLMIYFITLSVASTSSLLAGYLLAFHALVLLTLFLFKRVYYTSWIFFSTACALTLLFFPFSLWVLSHIIAGKAYFPGFLSWIGGGVATWILSFPLLSLFQWIDHLTITQSAEHKQPGVL